MGEKNASNYYEMEIDTRYFNYIKFGTKRIELRLLYKGRDKIKIGDTIRFIDVSDRNNTMCVKVIALLYYSSFKALLDDFDISVVADEGISKNKLLEDLNEIYPFYKQLKYNVLGIKFEIYKI